MTKRGEQLEFENDQVRVFRVRFGAREKHPMRSRHDRVLIWLTDEHSVRTEPDGKKKEIRHRAGEVAWRSASQHQIENLEEGQEAEVIIVELRR